MVRKITLSILLAGSLLAFDPYELMVSAGNVEAMSALLKTKKYDINIAEPEDGYTALMFAARDGHTDVVQLYLDNGANINAQSKTGQFTALMLAVGNSQSSTTELLLKRGAKVDMVDDEGRTALMLACIDGMLDNVKLLLAHKANPKLKSKADEVGYTAYEYAQMKAKFDVVEYLESIGIKE